MAKIMVVAGGDWQCPIVKTAKKMGHQVICSNLYENSPAFAYADVGEVANVLDKEKNLEIAKKYMPDAILTDQSDIAVPTVAYVAEQLGRKGIGEDEARLFTNKYAMRDFCKDHGFAYPKYKLCHTVAEAGELLDELHKIIIKPLDSQSSRGVHIIENGEELEQCFPDAMQYSNAEKAVLAEQYIEGREFTVDGIKTEDAYHVTAISKKAHFAYNASIAKELLFSHYDDEYDYDDLREINKRMVEKMGLPFGLTHAEYKYMDGKFYLIEIAARGGGTKISSDIVPIMSGVNSNEIYINALLGKREKFSINYEKDKYAILGFFDFAPGKVTAIEGMEEVKKMQGVHEVGLNFKVGDTIGKAEDDRSRVGYYILYADSYQKLRRLESEMKGTLQIKYS